jgi:hypothetical protein
MMAQSSDFRLTHLDNGNTIIDSHTAQKQFVLQYPKWSGLLCFTGIAEYRVPGFSLDTAAWLQQALEHPPDQLRSPKDVVDVLMREGNPLLRRIPPKDRRLTLTMIAYDAKGIPRIWVISNYERPGQTFNTVGADDVFLTQLRARGPRCIVTGWAPAVSADQQAALLDLLASVPERTALSDAIAFTNRESSANAQDTVSRECSVATLAPDGSGQMLVYGELPQEFIPGVIIQGTSLPLVDILKQQGQLNKMLDGMAWPDRRQVLAHNNMIPVSMTFRDIKGYKWPDDPDAPPRESVPVGYVNLKWPHRDELAPPEVFMERSAGRGGGYEPSAVRSGGQGPLSLPVPTAR